MKRKHITRILALCLGTGLAAASLVTPVFAEWKNIPQVTDPEAFAAYKMDDAMRARILYQLPDPPQLLPTLTSDLLARGIKKRINLPTQVSSDDAAASAAMLLSSRGIRLSPDEVRAGVDATGLESQQAGIARFINEKVFHRPDIAPDGSGYRWAPYDSNPDNRHDNFKLFFYRLKQDIAEGYPLLLHVDSSLLYPGATGDRYVTCTGYFEDTTGAIAYLYFLDPSAQVQDSRWAGLKYIPLDEMLNAMGSIPHGGYLW